MNLGATNIATLKLGSQQVSRVMLGSVEVWANMDADAAAYIAAIEGDGITVSATQKSALDAFYKAGKSDGWYSAIKRMYLPIWANETPNARCMVSGTSGAFAGGVTHAAGYVKGDGTSGCFNTNTKPADIGVNSTTGMMSVLVNTLRTPNGNAYHGCSSGAADRFSLGLDGGNDAWWFHSANAYQFGQGLPFTVGILIGVTTAETTSFVKSRLSGGVTTKNYSGTSFGPTPDFSAHFMARNVEGIPSFYNNAQHGAFLFGVKMSEADADNLTLALKTLWETCTGLTLP
jgi:hypothetical protein